MAHDLRIGESDYKYVSGSCDRPAKGLQQDVVAYGIEVGELCVRIMANADSLRVWLSVTLKVSLDADELSDLYAFTNMVNICPLDEEFGEVLQKFEGAAGGNDLLGGWWQRWLDSVLGTSVRPLLRVLSSMQCCTIRHLSPPSPTSPPPDLVQGCMDVVNSHKVLFAWLGQTLYPILLTMVGALVLGLRQRFPLLDKLIPPPVLAFLDRSHKQKHDNSEPDGASPTSTGADVKAKGE